MRKFILADCMNPETGLPSYPDKFFDLAIVDPPYGINISADLHKRGQTSQKFGYKQWAFKDWDSKIPNEKYFDELVRVSKNQIIWGGNYFFLPPTRCWLVWDKCQRGFSFADAELAWTSFDKSVRIFSWSRGKTNRPDKIHVTQKPVEIYKWLLENYAKPGDLILDTHVGSASSLIACEQMGFNYVGYEIDPDYYRDAVNRMKKGIQTNLFAPGESKAERELIQTKLFEQ